MQLRRRASHSIEISLKSPLSFVWSITGPRVLWLVPLELFQAVSPVLTVYLSGHLVTSLLTSGMQSSLLAFGFQALTLTLSQVTSELSGSYRLFLRTRLELTMLKRVFHTFAIYEGVQVASSEFQSNFRRVRKELHGLFDTVVNLFLDPLKTLITLTGFMIVLAQLHWAAPIFILVGGYLSSILIIKVSRERALERDRHAPLERHMEYLWSLPNTPSIHWDVSLLNLWQFLGEKWQSIWHHVQREKVSTRGRGDWGQIANEWIMMITSISVYLFVLVRTSQNEISIGGFVTTGAAIIGASGQIRQLVQTISSTFDRWSTVHTVTKFLSPPKPSPEPSPTSRLPDGPLQLRCDGLWFRYPGTADFALSEISFAVRAGERIMIVGGNGSGKSTLIKCLAGIQTPSRGVIHYRDLPLANLPRDWYYGKVGFCQQEFNVYDMTLYENIAMGDISRFTDQEAVRRTTAQVGLHEFAQSLPEEMNTVIGRWLDRGMSGGQLQRLALARVLFRNPELLLLDEPGAALDPPTRREILGRLLDWEPDRIKVFVSHDLKAHVWADRIFVLKDGRLVEQGTHEELLSKQGEYYAFWKEGQVKGQTESDDLIDALA